MAMLLPKGILLNTAEVYEEIAGYDVLPPEKLRQFWNVYTTTARRLRDPTAYRLENFWWHVWGSNKRFLSGPRLARLFEDFSNSPTFVPLKGPANRYEGPPTPRRHNTDRPRSQLRQPPTTKAEASGLASDSATNKLLVPSALKPPPSHTILKTPRKPSASGPRPKARFVSPPDGKGKDGEASSSSTAPDPSETSPCPALPQIRADPILPPKSLAEPLQGGATLGQQKDMAQALGITTQVQLVQKMQGTAPPEKNLIQNMQPIEDPGIPIPTGATLEPKPQLPQAPPVVPQKRTDGQKHLPQTRAPPGAAQGQPGKAAPQAPTTGPHEKPRLVKLPPGAAQPQQEGVPEGWIEVDPQRAPPKPKSKGKMPVRPEAPPGGTRAVALPTQEVQDPEVSAGSPPASLLGPPPAHPPPTRSRGTGMKKPNPQRPRPPKGSDGQHVATRDISGSASLAPGQRQKDKEAVQATGSRESIEYTVPTPELTERSQLVTRRFVVPAHASKRRLVMPRRASRQSSVASDSSAGRLTPTARAVRPPGVDSPESMNSQGTPKNPKGRSKNPRGTPKAGSAQPEPCLPSTEPAPQGTGEADQRPRSKALVPAPNPLPPDYVPNLDEFFVRASPVPRRAQTESPRLPPAAAGPVHPGAPAARPFPMVRSQSDINPRLPSALFAPSLFQATASTTTSDMTAQGEIGSDNAPPPTRLHLPRDAPESQGLSGPILQQFQPTAPSAAAPIRFGRSRSQLKVLLEAGIDNAGPSRDPGPSKDPGSA